MLLNKTGAVSRLASKCTTPVSTLLHPRHPARLITRVLPDHIHIDETVILTGSAAIALGVPALTQAYRQLTKHRPNEIGPNDLNNAINVAVIDVRAQTQRQQQGTPSLPESFLTFNVPWCVPAEGGFYQLNPTFKDDILHVAQQIPADCRLAFMDMDGEAAMQAAKEVSRIGLTQKLVVLRGGVQAWQEARLPFEAPTTTIDLADLQVELVEPVEAPIFRPKLLDTLTQGYTKEDLAQDVLSGLVVGVIALSLSMALGIASESTPAVGVTTAVVSGFITSVFGGSKVCIGGPTAAFIPIVLGVLHQYGPENLILCTGLSGAMLIAGGAMGLGSTIRFIPKPVVTGFTAGIASYILSTQIKDFLGLGVPGALPEGETIPSQFLEKLYYLGSHLDGTHLPSFALAAACLGLMLAWPKSWAKVAPPQIVAVIAGSVGLAGAGLMTGTDLATTVPFGMETLGSHFGADAIPSSLPAPHIPEGLLNPATLGPLVQPALSIALLGSIESLLCARVSDTMIGDKHNPNTELIAQGFANIASATFGGLPATGALARTAANVRAGGRSPVAGMVHAATILAIMMVAAPAAAYIPLPALSAVLVMVAINMGEWRHFRELPSWPERDAQLYLLAFALTVMQDVAVAVELGMGAALLLYVRDVTNTLQVRTYSAGNSLPGTMAARSPSPPEYVYDSDIDTATMPELMMTHMPPAMLSYADIPALSTMETPAYLPPIRTTPATASNGAYASAAAALEESRMLSSQRKAHQQQQVPGSPRSSPKKSDWEATGSDLATSGSDDEDANPYIQVPNGAQYLEVVGSLLFGGGQQLEQAVSHLCQPPSPSKAGGTPQRRRKVHAVILDLSHLTACDVSGLQVLEEMHTELKKAGVELVVVTPREQAFQMMAKAGFFSHLGKANTHRHLNAALSRAKSVIAAASAADRATTFTVAPPAVVKMDSGDAKPAVNNVVPVAGSVKFEASGNGAGQAGEAVKATAKDAAAGKKTV